MKYLNLITKILWNLKVLIRIQLKKASNVKDCRVTGIVFSMDRPIQLFALLESYYKYCYDPAPLKVLYKATSKDYLNGYKEIEKYFDKHDITFIEELSFRKDLIGILKDISSSFLFFLVDDIIFKSAFSFGSFLSLAENGKYIFSLRLGQNLDYCYTMDLKQNLPVFKKVQEFLTWDLKSSEIDWKYAFSVDGHLYKTNEIFEMTSQLSFKAPNSYEASMNVFRFILRRKKGLCYPNSILVNVCLNRVQEEIKNISGDYTPSELLNLWNEDKKINIDYFHRIMNKSAHIEINELPIKKRK